MVFISEVLYKSEQVLLVAAAEKTSRTIVAAKSALKSIVFAFEVKTSNETVKLFGHFDTHSCHIRLSTDDYFSDYYTIDNIGAKNNSYENIVDSIGTIGKPGIKYICWALDKFAARETIRGMTSVEKHDIVSRVAKRRTFNRMTGKVRPTTNLSTVKPNYLRPVFEENPQFRLFVTSHLSYGKDSKEKANFKCISVARISRQVIEYIPLLLEFYILTLNNCLHSKAYKVCLMKRTCGTNYEVAGILTKDDACIDESHYKLFNSNNMDQMRSILPNNAHYMGSLDDGFGAIMKCKHVLSHDNPNNCVAEIGEGKDAFIFRPVIAAPIMNDALKMMAGFLEKKHGKPFKEMAPLCLIDPITSFIYRMRPNEKTHEMALLLSNGQIIGVDERSTSFLGNALRSLYEWTMLKGLFRVQIHACAPAQSVYVNKDYAVIEGRHFILKNKLYNEDDGKYKIDRENNIMVHKSNRDDIMAKAYKILGLTNHFDACIGLLIMANSEN